MSEQPDLFKNGAELRDEGIKRAVDHADRVEERWSDRAFELFKEYIRARRVFMTEDVRMWAHKDRDLPLPPDGRAWGAVTVRAVKQRLIRRIGYAPMKSPNCHQDPKPVWQSRIP